MPDMSLVSNVIAKGLIDLPAGLPQMDVNFYRISDIIFGGRLYYGNTMILYVNIHKYTWSGWYTFNLTKVE